MVTKQDDEKRNEYMDFLKGIAILAVMVGHVFSDISGTEVLFDFIYSFHMPLLFFVSAYLEEQYKAKYEGREWRMMFNRMRGLLFPYVSWTLIGAAVSGWLWSTSITEFGEYLFGYGNNGLWFFPVLFGLKIMHALYWVIRCKASKDAVVTDVVILGGLVIFLVLFAVLTRQPYSINMLSYAIPYFFAVIIVRHAVIQKLLRSEWLTACVMLAYVLVFPYFSFSDMRWITQVIRIGLSLCIIIVCFRLGDRWYMSRVHSIICVYGENSLAIYVLNGFLIDYKVYLNMIDSVLLIGVLSIALAFLVGAVCIVIAKVLGISAWWRRILFGK